jgi:hypothetical protein
MRCKAAWLFKAVKLIEVILSLSSHSVAVECVCLVSSTLSHTLSGCVRMCADIHPVHLVRCFAVISIPCLRPQIFLGSVSRSAQRGGISTARTSRRTSASLDAYDSTL